MENNPYFCYGGKIAQLLNWDEILFTPGSGDRSNVSTLLITIQKIGGPAEIPLMRSAYQKVNNKNYEYRKNFYKRLDREIFLETINICKQPLKSRPT